MHHTSRVPQTPFLRLGSLFHALAGGGPLDAEMRGGAAPFDF